MDTNNGMETTRRTFLQLAAGAAAAGGVGLPSLAFAEDSVLKPSAAVSKWIALPTVRPAALNFCAVTLPSP